MVRLVLDVAATQRRQVAQGRIAQSTIRDLQTSSSLSPVALRERDFEHRIRVRVHEISVRDARTPRSAWVPPEFCPTTSLL
jgi:hypothetical protein